MKLTKLSLAVVATMALAGGANAADTFAEAFSNGKASAEFRFWYFSKQDTDVDDKYANFNNIGVQLGYVTDPFYGFRLGLTGQGNVSIGTNKFSKKMWDKEQWGNGAVLSEAYLGYTFGKTDIKAGRQFVTTPIVAGNPTRIFHEAFEGISVTSKDIADTSLYANWFYKFQGRTKLVNEKRGTTESSRAPIFKDRVILAGVGPWTHEFDNVYSIGVSNKSVPNLTLAAQYARVDGLNWNSSASGNSHTKKGEVNLYYAEANYVLPLESLKLKFDAQYRGSRTSVDGRDETNSGKNGEKRGYDGDMIGLRVGFADLVGISGSVAFSSVTNDNALVVGVGNGPTTYTMLPIRGPYVFTSHAGVDVWRFDLGYDFKQVGVDGLKLGATYVTGEQDGQANNYDVKGWGLLGSYNVPYAKGLNVAATYTELEKDYERDIRVGSQDREEKEFWLKFTYKISNK